MSLRSPGPRVAAPTPTPDVAAAAGYFHAPPAPQAQPQPLVPPPQGGTLRSEHVQQAGGTGEGLLCPRCAERSPPDNRFCHGCGYNFVAPAAPQPITQLAAPASPQIPQAAQQPSGSHGALPPPSGPYATMQSPTAPREAPPAQEGVPSPRGPLAQTQAPRIMPASPTAPTGGPPVSVVCGRCRGVADPGADFCKFCGARLGANDPASNGRQSNARPSSPMALSGGSGASEIAPPTPAHYPHQPQTALSMPHPPAAGIPLEEQPNQLTRPLHGIGDVSVRARLVRIAKDGSEGAQHAITAEVTDVGRTEGNILLADDPYLSTRHARISVRRSNDPNAAPSLVLTDLASVNGVYVRLRSPHVLVAGDLLLCGQQVLRFEAVTEIEGARGPAMQHGVLLFGSPAPVTRARLVQRTVEGLARDVLYLLRDEFVVGREVGDRTYPEDVFMSRRHAAVRRDGQNYVLHDLGSSNGTFVQIHDELVLHDGDQFRIGHHLFRVDVPAPGGVS